MKQTIEWVRNQIKEFEKEYESQSSQERCLFIDGKLTILKLWLAEKEYALMEEDKKGVFIEDAQPLTPEGIRKICENDAKSRTCEEKGQ